MAISENDKVAEAQKQLKEILADPETRALLELHEKAEIDRKMDLAAEHKKGREEGEKIID